MSLELNLPLVDAAKELGFSAYTLRKYAKGQPQTPTRPKFTPILFEDQHFFRRASGRYVFKMEETRQRLAELGYLRTAKPD